MTHALVLAGGGAYGAYQVGVIRALLTGQCCTTNGQPLDARIVAGASAGAFNGALLASAAERGPDAVIEHLEHTWLDDLAERRGSCGNGVFRLRLDASRFVEPGCFVPNPAWPFAQFAEDAVRLASDLSRRGLRVLTQDGSVDQRVLELIDVETFVDTEPFRRVIRRAVSAEAIRLGGIVLQVATINWKTGALRMFDNDDFTDVRMAGIIEAATAIPGLFPSVDIDGAPYADASFVLNSPLKPPIAAGADELHVVYFNPDVETVPLPRVRNTVSTLNRAVLITLGAMMNRDIEIASRVNLALDVMRRSGRAATPRESRAVLHEVGSRFAADREPSDKHRHVIIHRYHASEGFGPTFQWLTFDRRHIEQLIEHGYEDTARHDCVANKCILGPSFERASAGRAP